MKQSVQFQIKKVIPCHINIEYDHFLIERWFFLIIVVLNIRAKYARLHTKKMLSCGRLFTLGISSNVTNTNINKNNATRLLHTKQTEYIVICYKLKGEWMDICNVVLQDLKTLFKREHNTLHLWDFAQRFTCVCGHFTLDVCV